MLAEQKSAEELVEEYQLALQRWADKLTAQHKYLTLFYDSRERIIQAIRNRGYTNKVRLRGLTPK